MSTLALDDLRGAMRGPVLGPDDLAYEAGRAVFNGLMDRHPAVIARCACVADVGAAVAFGRRHDLEITVRGGGHGVGGHAICDDGMMIDLRLLRSVSVDPGARRVRVGGGATWRDVDTPCAEHGLVVPGGTFDTTGVAGLTLSGGIGHLMGPYGLTLDSLVSAEVVLADGRTVTASATADPDLLWALRGGGGNFGVVTAFEFALHPLPAVWGGTLIFGDAHLADAVRLVRDVMAAAPDELTVMLLLAPDDPGAVALVTVCYAGETVAAEEAVRPLRESLPVLGDGLGLTSYLQIQVMVGDEPFGVRAYWKGHFVRELTDVLIDELVGLYRAHPQGSADVVLIEPMHGAALRVPADAAAFSRRERATNVSAMATWGDASDDEAQVAWARRTAAALEPHSVSGGGYLNYGAPDEPLERVRAAYGDAKFARLRELKRRYDPDNVFRHNHNIPPA
jgi:FAD/FMN-containing dehydrogenase